MIEHSQDIYGHPWYPNIGDFPPHLPEKRRILNTMLDNLTASINNLDSYIHSDAYGCGYYDRDIQTLKQIVQRMHYVNNYGPNTDVPYPTTIIYCEG